MDERRGSISCSHGYIRQSDCPTCRELMRFASTQEAVRAKKSKPLKTLALFSWEPDSSGNLVGRGPRTETVDYVAVVTVSTATNGGFLAIVTLNGNVIHQSEHGSRNDGQSACGEALRRAIDLREGP